MSEFKIVLSDTRWSDELYRFLQVVFHLYPEDKFHQLIATCTRELSNDADIYTSIQKQLPSIKPFLSELSFALPALRKQKQEMSRQVLKCLGDQTRINGYLEIGSTGRYIAELRKHIQLTGDLYVCNDIAPSYSIADIAERGQLAKIGSFIPLTYEPIEDSVIPNASVDLITCHIGLHHCTPDMMDGFLRSIHRILRQGGRFIMREHDVRTPEMATFVSLVHTVFNLGLNVPCETNSSEYKSFQSIDNWCSCITAQGFEDSGLRILQDNDPSLNTLLSFTKV